MLVPAFTFAQQSDPPPSLPPVSPLQTPLMHMPLGQGSPLQVFEDSPFETASFAISVASESPEFTQRKWERISRLSARGTFYGRHLLIALSRAANAALTVDTSSAEIFTAPVL